VRGLLLSAMSSISPGVSHSSNDMNLSRALIP
jgi:hypothetical protein